MTTTSILFYGIFTHVIQLAIATKVHFDFINIYDPLILELTNHRSATNLPNIPLELWNQIKQELRPASVIKLKVDFATFLACDCCKAGQCLDNARHSGSPGYNDHGSLIPAHPEDTTIYDRECCSDLNIKGGNFQYELDALEKWMCNAIDITTPKLEQFLSFFNLKLVIPDALDTNHYKCSYFYAYAVGSSQAVERVTDADANRDEAGLYRDFTTISTTTLRSFDYDSVDLSFKKLREEYGVYGENFNQKSRPANKVSLIGPDKDFVPAWRLWTRC